MHFYCFLSLCKKNRFTHLFFNQVDILKKTLCSLGRSGGLGDEPAWGWCDPSIQSHPGTSWRDSWPGLLCELVQPLVAQR